MRPDVEEAILGMYEAIDGAARAQREAGRSDQGRRSGITSGRHLDPVAELIKSDLIGIGFDEQEVFNTGNSCVLPGWFRPTKCWDILGFAEDNLVCAIELKSISSSFSNNANNRSEESIGSAVDALEAFEENLFGDSNIPPVMGYVMIVKDCEDSRSFGRQPRSQHFDIDPVFNRVSYLDRFHILCERLQRKSLYNAVWLVFADPDNGEAYEPDPSMSYEMFIEHISMGLALHRKQKRQNWSRRG